MAMYTGETETRRVDSEKMESIEHIQTVIQAHFHENAHQLSPENREEYTDERIAALSKLFTGTDGYEGNLNELSEMPANTIYNKFLKWLDRLE